jgi:hypothetical protein
MRRQQHARKLKLAGDGQGRVITRVHLLFIGGRDKTVVMRTAVDLKLLLLLLLLLLLPAHIILHAQNLTNNTQNIARTQQNNTLRFTCFTAGAADALAIKTLAPITRPSPDAAFSCICFSSLSP